MRAICSAEHFATELPRNLRDRHRTRLADGDELQDAREAVDAGPDGRRFRRAVRAETALQAELVTEEEVGRMLRTGVVTVPWADEWQRSWRRLVINDFDDIWTTAARAAGEVLRPGMERIGATIAESDIALRTWIETRSGERIVQFTDAQLQAFRETFRRALVDQPSIHARQMRDLLRDVVPLDARRADQVRRFRQAQVEGGLSAGRVEARTRRFARKKQTQRIDAIARTETTDAFNQSTLDAVDGAHFRGELPQGSVRAKECITALDERVSPCCGPLHGVVILWAESFEPVGCPPAPRPTFHTNCRCTVSPVLLTAAPIRLAA